MVQIWSMLASGGRAARQHGRSSSSRSRRAPRPGSPTCAATTTSAGRSPTRTAGRSASTRSAHRRFLSEWYSGSFPGSWARGLVFQQNNLTGDRRISGSLASLAGLEAGDPDAARPDPAGARDRPRLRRRPVLWMGDELGLLNDAGWADDPAHARRQPLGAPAADALARATRPSTASTRGCATSSRYAAPSRTCTPPRPPRSGTRATRACCWSSAGTRSGPLLGAYNVTADERVGRRRRAALARAAHVRGCTTRSATGSPSSTRARSGSRRTPRPGSTTATVP